MSVLRKTLLAAATLSSLSLSTAYAQEAVVAEVVSNEANTADGVSSVEGRGIEVGTGVVIHPAIGIEGGVNDNVFFETRNENKQSAGLLRLTGTFHIASRRDRVEDLGDAEEGSAELTPRMVEFRAGLRAAYVEYLASSDNVRGQRNLNLDATGDVTVNPAGPLSVLVHDGFTRDQRAPNFEDSSTLNRDENHLRIGLSLHPLERTIASTIYYENWLHIFENPGISKFANRMNQTIGWRTDYRWLPRTMLSADVSYGFFGPRGDSKLMGETYKTDSRPLRAVAGLATNLSEMTTLKVHAGYARASYGQGEGYSSPVLGAEFGVRWSETGRFVALYDYDHFDSFNANFYRDHTIAARAIQRIGAVILDGGPEVRFRYFGGIPMQLGNPSRNDVVVDALARAQIVFADKFSAFAQYRLGLVDTNYRANVFDSMGNAGGTDDPSFARNEVSVGVRAAY